MKTVVKLRAKKNKSEEWACVKWQQCRHIDRIQSSLNFMWKRRKPCWKEVDLARKFQYHCMTTKLLLTSEYHQGDSSNLEMRNISMKHSRMKYMNVKTDVLGKGSPSSARIHKLCTFTNLQRGSRIQRFLRQKDRDGHFQLCKIKT